ncbi:MAG: hypothetical protein KDD48_01330 [Bdellovibrionales bacterium]|nr:hypothetical protein [Bdellovibrionales bacterium]
MLKRFISIGFISLLIFFVFHGCGGSDSVDLSVSDVSNINGTFDAMEGLLNSLQESSSSRLSTRAQGGNSEGSFAGCQNDQETKRTIDNLREVRVNMCAVGAMVDAGAVTIPSDESFAYMHLIFAQQPGDNQQSNEEFVTRVRVRYFVNADGKDCMQMDRCEPNGSQQFVQVHSFQACNAESGGKKGILVQDRNSHEENSETRNSWMQIGAFGRASSGTVDLSSLAIEAAYDESTYGSGHGILSAVKEDRRIDMNWVGQNSYSNNEGSFSNEFQMCSIRGKGEGIVNFSGTMTVPSYEYQGQWYCPPSPDSPDGQSDNSTQGASCGPLAYDHTEAFTVQRTPELFFGRLEPYQDSIWFASLSDSCEANTVSVQDFPNSWDCEATDSSFVEIDVNADATLEENFLPCFEKDASQFEDSYQSCDQQYRNGQN